MKNKTVEFLALVGLIFLVACSGNDDIAETDSTNQNTEEVADKPHQFLGWYCPDNLRGLPAVDMADWKSVPVINGRMPTLEEAQNGSSLIYVDPVEYPDAKPLNMRMPKLATFYNESARREDLIIVIQAIKVGGDSIVGFRYLNGGNGTALVNQVKFLSDTEIDALPLSKFVSVDIKINATQDQIWEVLTNPDYNEKLQSIFDDDKNLEINWRKNSNVNYHYAGAGNLIASIGDKVFGNFYIQNDYDSLQFTEKFMLMENPETGITELLIVCGPFTTDFEEQKKILTEWGEKVKILSEKW